MSKKVLPSDPVRRVWAVFGIAWLIVIGVIASWHGFVVSRAHPFTRSYVLGVDQVDERHELAWLASGGYGVRVRTPSGLGLRDVGDIAVEMTDESGNVIVPRKFIFRDKPQVAIESDGGTTTHHLEGLRAGLFERFTLRVITVKKGESARATSKSRSSPGLPEAIGAGSSRWSRWSLA